MVEHDQRGGGVGAAVHKGLDAAGGEGAVLVVAVGDIDDGGGAGLAVGEDLLAGLDYLDGAPALEGQHDGRAGAGAVVLAAEAATHEGDVDVEVRGLRPKAADMLFLMSRPPCSLDQSSMPPSTSGTTTLTWGSMKQWLTRGNS